MTKNGNKLGPLFDWSRPNLEPDVCANYHGGIETSVEAHARTPRAAREAQRALVLEAIRAMGARGLTSDEAEGALGLSHQACSARFTELRTDGWIVYALDDDGRKVKRRTRLGRNALVHVSGASS